MRAAKLMKGADGPSDVARLLGYSSPQKITNWMSRGVSKEGLLDAQRLLGISASWLQTGDGEMIERASKHELLNQHSAINAPKRYLIKGIPTRRKDSITEDVPSRDIRNATLLPLGQREIPVISYVQAGMMTEAVDPFSLGDGFETIQPTVECSMRTFALRLEGDSMEPKFHDGDVVIIDPERAPRPGNFVVAKNGKEEATFKKYRPRGTDERGEIVFELVPLNDDYPTLHSERDHLRIIGVCVERREIMI